MRTESKKKMSQQKEEFQSTTLREVSTKVEMEDLVEIEDVEDLVEEVDDR
jgi:hypothetical protein